MKISIRVFKGEKKNVKKKQVCLGEYVGDCPGDGVNRRNRKSHWLKQHRNYDNRARLKWSERGSKEKQNKNRRGKKNKKTEPALQLGFRFLGRKRKKKKKKEKEKEQHAFLPPAATTTPRLCSSSQRGRAHAVL